ncbi:pentapeptide repeat-containing protein [Dyella sp.]|jgi:uncharacterized protein YjbI with pentapeptide repeats|uniref:pentapeptide repeat-containing protein n=1 Tax=Dyella sp. TaxID=1869338 RepID=UPI002FDA147F
MASTQAGTITIMPETANELAKQLHVLAEANREAARSGNQQALHASQKALAVQLRKLTSPFSELPPLQLEGINLNGYREPIRCSLGIAFFYGADLTLVDFTSSEFEGSSFRGAILDRTVMAQARLRTCFFDKAIMDATDFRHAWLRTCDMRSVEFRQYPQVTGARMEGSFVSQIFLDHLKSLDRDHRPNSLPKVPRPRTPADT